MSEGTPLKKFRAYLAYLVESLAVLVGALGTICGALGTAFVIAHFTVGESSIVVAFLNNGAHWLVLGAFLGGIAALATPYRWVWAPLCLPGAVMFVVWYGRLFVPLHFAAQDENPLVVATFNIAGGARAVDQTILDIDADIIGIQEYGRYDTFALRRTYPHRINEGGLGILSKYPITAVTNIGRYPRGGLAGLRAVIDVNGQPVSVYSAHPRRPALEVRPLLYDPELRELAFDELAFHIERDTHPVILLCDCNTSSHTADYHQMRALLRDGWFDAGFGLGLTAPNAPLRLIRADYIWYSSEVRLVSIQRWMDTSSDHLPVVARFGLPE